MLCQQLRPRKIDNHPGTSGSGYSCGYLGSTPRVLMRRSKYRYSFRWSLTPDPSYDELRLGIFFSYFKPNRSVISTFTSDLKDISLQFASHTHTHTQWLLNVLVPSSSTWPLGQRLTACELPLSMTRAT